VARLDGTVSAEEGGRGLRAQGRATRQGQAPGTGDGQGLVIWCKVKKNKRLKNTEARRGRAG